MNVIDLCRQLTSIDSSADHGTKMVAQFVDEMSRSWGLEVEQHHFNVDGIENTNIICHPKRRAPEQLLLITCLDTANPGHYAQWIRTGANPFNASLDGETIYGLGVGDAKSDFLAKWIAMKNIAERKYEKVSPVLVGTFGRESGAGTIRLIRKKAVNPVGVLVGAATKMQLANCGPGYAKVEISIPFTDEERKYHESHNLAEGSYSQSKIFMRQKSDLVGHDLFSNPIFKTMEYLKKIPEGTAIMSVEGGVSSDTEPDSAELELDLVDQQQSGVLTKLLRIATAISNLSAELKSVVAPSLTPPHSTITLGMVRTYPEQIQLSGICRLVPTSGREVYEAWLEKLRLECAAAGATFHILDYKPPYYSTDQTAFFQLLKGVSSEVGMSGQLTGTNRCTEASVFARMSVPSAAFGPGAWEPRESAALESVQLGDINRAIVFYKRFIERFCQ